MDKLNNILQFQNDYIINDIDSIKVLSMNWDYNNIVDFFLSYKIDTQIDQEIIHPYTMDWSNIPGGKAEILVRPKTAKQCAIVLRACQKCKIPITISAGQTNLTGSATPMGGIILSTSFLKDSNIQIDIEKKEVLTPVGITLESMRDEVLQQSNNTLYYPVDPTSRHDAYVGGTLSCNASGFIPGEKGATRYWVQAIDLVLLNG